MNRCCVNLCGHLQKRDACRMFLFPTNQNLRETWERSIKTKKPVTKRTRICECHFPGGDRLCIPSLNVGTEESIGENGFEQVIEVTDSSYDDDEARKMYELQATLEELDVEVAHQREIYNYRKDRVTFFHLKQNAKMFHFYTSLGDLMDFQVIACDVIETANNEQVVLHEDLAVEEQVLLTLMKLRRNFEVADLAFRFRISESVTYNVLNTVIRLLNLKYGVDCSAPPPATPCEDVTIDLLNIAVKLHPPERTEIKLKVLLLIENQKVIGKSLVYETRCTNEQLLVDWQKQQLAQDSIATPTVVENFKLNQLTETTSHFCKMLTYFEILREIPARLNTLVNEILTVCIGILKQKSSKLTFEDSTTS